MKIETEEYPYTIINIDCCQNHEVPKTVQHKFKKLRFKDGKLICPLCRQPMTAEMFIEF